MSSSQPSESRPLQALPESFDRRHATHARPYSIWDVPQAVKRIFSKFPLAARTPEPQPAYLSRIRKERRDGDRLQLWLSTLSEDWRKPSYNANCLKYQAYLAASDIAFDVVRTTSNGAPDGRLPFLMKIEPGNKPPRIVESEDLEKFVRSRQSAGASQDGRATMQAEGMGLIERDIRAAWLYSSYLTPLNLQAVVSKLYAANVTHAGLSRYLILDRILSDAREEFNKMESIPDIGCGQPSAADRGLATVLYKQAGCALDDLCTMLDGTTFFSGNDQPGLMDCTIFAYTYLITTSPDTRWEDTRLGDEFRKRRGLMQHMGAVHQYCFGDQPEAAGPRDVLEESQNSYLDGQSESSRFSVINESACQDSQQSYEHLSPSSWEREISGASQESALPESQAAPDVSAGESQRGKSSNWP